ncbi:MAG TPA: glycoside hydrolase family 5 protein [Planctomycetota bacterium]
MRLTVRNVLLSLLLCVSCAAEEPAYRRGVNIAGADFGDVPGKIHQHYTYNDEATFKYFAEKGCTVLRVPFKWERMQPALGGPLDPQNLECLKKNVAWAKAHGTTVIFDVHNYCRYQVKVGGKPVGCLIDAVHDGEVRVKTADLCDLWVKLSQEFKDEPAVYGYGLMNEPHDMGKSDWKAISNAVVKAIRDSGDKKLILVGGDHWSNASGWEKINGPTSWVNDPANNFLYEAHCYCDADNSGSYKKTYEQELAKNPNLPTIGRERLKGFIEWCKKNNVRGFLGEFAVPRTDPRWMEVLENQLQALDEAGFGGTYWAAGTYWGDYPMSAHPTDKFTKDRPQMEVLVKHLGPKSAKP